MYKAVVRAIIRRSIASLNAGDLSVLFRLVSPDAALAFPGNNSWASEYRPVVKGRAQHVTHRGIEECRTFAQRFAEEGIQLIVEDMLVNGPPWNTRIAVRAHDYSLGADGTDQYNNRAVAFLVIRWGRLVSWEDYEDTERVAAWDAARSAASAAAHAG